MLTGPPFKFTGPISTLPPPPNIKNYFKLSVRTILTYFTTFKLFHAVKGCFKDIHENIFIF